MLSRFFARPSLISIPTTPFNTWSAFLHPHFLRRSLGRLACLCCLDGLTTISLTNSICWLISVIGMKNSLYFNLKFLVRKISSQYNLSITSCHYSLTQQWQTRLERCNFVHHMRMPLEEYRNTSLLDVSRPCIRPFSNDSLATYTRFKSP